MHHHHDSHGHDHAHHAPAQGRAFMIGIGLNIGFIAVEIAAGLAANSLALLADAAHNVGDVLGLIMAGAALWVSRLRPTPRYTYGLRSTSILAALANAILLMVVTGGIAWDAILRLTAPQPVQGGIVMAVAACGIAVNGATALLFAKGRADDLNIRAAFLHMLADAIVSAGVVTAGLLVLWTDRAWLDPLASLIVAAVIILGTWGLLKESACLALHAVPAHIDPAAVRDFLLHQADVHDVHDLHIWGMSTSETALSAHIDVAGGYPGGDFIAAIGRGLDERFRIGHATLQIETGASLPCPQADSAAV